MSWSRSTVSRPESVSHPGSAPWSESVPGRDANPAPGAPYPGLGAYPKPEHNLVWARTRFGVFPRSGVSRPRSVSQPGSEPRLGRVPWSGSTVSRQECIPSRERTLFGVHTLVWERHIPAWERILNWSITRAGRVSGRGIPRLSRVPRFRIVPQVGACLVQDCTQIGCVPELGRVRWSSSTSRVRCVPPVWDCTPARSRTPVQERTPVGAGPGGNRSMFLSLTSMVLSLSLSLPLSLNSIKTYPAVRIKKK